MQRPGRRCCFSHSRPQTWTPKPSTPSAWQAGPCCPSPPYTAPGRSRARLLGRQDQTEGARVGRHKCLARGGGRLGGIKEEGSVLGVRQQRRLAGCRAEALRGCRAAGLCSRRLSCLRACKRRQTTPVPGQWRTRDRVSSSTHAICLARRTSSVTRAVAGAL